MMPRQNNRPEGRTKKPATGMPNGNEVNRELAELAVRLKGVKVAELTRKLLLSQGERRRLANEELHSRHIADTWAALRRVSRTRAVLDIARGLDLLAEGRYRWLLRETGQNLPAAASGQPEWDRDRCELRYRGQVVRKIRSLKVAENIVAILDAFQTRGWPDRVEHPLAGCQDDQRLRETVASLNRQLAKLRFHCDGSGAGVLWSVVDRAQRT